MLGEAAVTLSGVNRPYLLLIIGKPIVNRGEAFENQTGFHLCPGPVEACLLHLYPDLDPVGYLDLCPPGDLNIEANGEGILFFIRMTMLDYLPVSG